MYAELAVDFYGTSIKRYFKSLQFSKQLCISLLCNDIFSFLFLLAVTSVVISMKSLLLKNSLFNGLRIRFNCGEVVSTVPYATWELLGGCR